MKKFLALALLSLSFNTQAFDQLAKLDFSNLYGNTNAGIYEMKVSFEPKKSISTSGLTFSTHRDDNDLYCVTTATFEVGTMNMSVVNVLNGWTTSVTKKVSASVSIQSEDETCETNIEKLAGKQALYASLSLDAITLPVKAPFDYKTVGMYLAPFNGYLYLNSTVEVNGDKLVVNPSELLTEASIKTSNTNNASVTYYVFATKEATTLSLGTGLIKF